MQGDKTLSCTSCLFILAYNDKYTHNYLTIPTSRLITLIITTISNELQLKNIAKYLIMYKYLALVNSAIELYNVSK